MNTVNQQVDGNGNIVAGSGDVQSNSFDSSGGMQNTGIGPGAIGCQNNYYLNQPAPPPIPRQLPAPEPCFLHREDELVWLNDRLHPGKVVAVCGPGGMGKSALVAQAVDKLEASRFPDGIVFHTFYGHPKTEEALRSICDAFDVEAKPPLDSTVRNTLSGRKALLILDGAERADDLPALLKLRGMCGVLITSRKTEDAPDELRELKKLEKAQAAEVFRHYSKIAGDDANVAGICKILDGWPVALRIAGQYLRRTKESAADYLKWLEQEPFKELGSGKHEEENAALLLRRSVDAVSDDARFALGLAGCLAFAPIAREPVAAILDGDERRARAALNELVNYGLLEKREERWQVSHALVHTYARTELAMSTESLERLARWYIDFCKAVCEEGVKGYARLDGERAHCLRLMESCLNRGLIGELSHLVGEMDIYLDLQGYWIDYQVAFNMMLTGSRQAGHLHNQGWCLNQLGLICRKSGEYKKALAYFEQSLPIFRKLGEKKEESDILNNIGWTHDAQGNDDQALQYYKKSLKIRRKVKDRRGEGTTLNNIAMVSSQGDYETALKYLKHDIAICRNANDKVGEAATLNNFGALYFTQNNFSKALQYWEQALAIVQQLGDRAGEAVTRCNIGLPYVALGDITQAEEHISIAVQIAEKIGHPDLEEWRKTLAHVRAARRG